MSLVTITAFRVTRTFVSARDERKDVTATLCSVHVLALPSSTLYDVAQLNVRERSACDACITEMACAIGASAEVNS